MKIILVGKNLGDIRPLLASNGFIEECDAPELVVAHGGDGALLGAARAYPYLPLLPIRDARTAPLCPQHECTLQLAAFREKRTRLTRMPKVCGSVRDVTLHALNDVFLHNNDRSSALRYRVRINAELYANEVVGDAVGISSVHGSTAYYKSITHSLFRVGIGLAFSNSTEEVSHLVLDASSTVEIEVVRGPGILIADNSPERPLVSEGEIVTFRQSGGHADVYGLENFMCPACRALRHPSPQPRPAGWPF
ncbi:MAG: hypothetical protein HPZ91_11045 [Lentisphaeria bacterium]|nr:hypothetical protein [Lentisphaeria bacterium]